MKDQLQAAISNTCNDLFGHQLNVQLSRPEQALGDFSTNVAMQLAKPLKKKPQEIAEAVAASLQQLEEVAEVTVAGPGFINIKIKESILSEAVGQAMAADGTFGRSRLYQGQPIVIETNNPNPFKDLHIGHAYNSVVADTIANLLDAGGGDVHRVSYHGDVGLHVGKSMWAILRHIDKDPARLMAIDEAERPAFLSRMYTEGSTAYEADEAIKEEINELSRESFSLHDPLYREVYQTCKQWSFDYIGHTVQRLGSKPVEKRYLERDADLLGATTVKSHVGEVFEVSDGAVIFPESRSNIHTEVFISRDGRGLYAARDLGLMQMKHQDFSPKRSIIVTGSEQRNYFKVVIRAAEMVLPELSGVTKNISTGLVKLSTGKMSSRTGEVLNIEWLFGKLAAAVAKRGSQADSEIIIGALRYTLLKSRIGSDVVFDINESVSVEGNSGPYLQYAHARARSILQKADKPSDRKALNDVRFNEGERALALKLTEYPEIIERAASELLPHYVCTYLYELAQTFNSFYEKNRVIGDDREAVRLALVAAYANVLGSGLSTLGIPAPERI